MAPLDRRRGAYLVQKLPAWMRVHLLAAGVVALQTSPVGARAPDAPDAPAEGEGTAVVIQCAQLSAEERAAVEARARTELVLQGARSGVLRFACDPLEITAHWQGLDGLPPITERRSPDVEASMVDDLVTLASLVIERSLETSASSTPGPTQVPHAPTTNESPTPKSSPKTPEHPAPAPSIPLLEPEVASLDTSPKEPAPSELLVGVGLDTWFVEVSGTAGPLVGLALPITQPVSVRASSALGFGLNEARSVSVRHVVVEGALELTATRWLLASLGGGWSSMSFVSSSALPEGSSFSHSALFTAALRFVPRTSSARLTLGPVVRFVPKAREVALDERVVLTPPRLWAALELEARFAL